MKHMKKILALALVALSLMAVALPAMAATWPPTGYRQAPASGEVISSRSAYYAPAGGSKNIFINLTNQSGNIGVVSNFMLEAWDSAKNTYIDTGVRASCGGL